MDSCTARRQSAKTIEGYTDDSSEPSTLANFGRLADDEPVDYAAAVSQLRYVQRGRLPKPPSATTGSVSVAEVSDVLALGWLPIGRPGPGGSSESSSLHYHQHSIRRVAHSRLPDTPLWRPPGAMHQAFRA